MSNFTNEQKTAIYTTNKNLLVAAAAGSGKTAVLVERIINLITNESEPVPLDRLLVVTFTEAAAGEMKRRILKALTDYIEKDPENAFLRQQIALVNKASISTIHAFCLKVIREYFYMVDIDPSFKIADIAEANIMKAEILEEIFEEEYANSENELFIKLIESYGGVKTNDNKLAEVILGLYSFLEGIPWSRDWLAEKIEYFNIDISTTISETVWFPIIKERILKILESVLETIELCIYFCERPDGPETYRENFISDKILIEGLIKSCEKDYKQISNAFFEAKFENLSPKKPKENADVDLKEYVQKIRSNQIKKPIKDIKDNIFIKDEIEQLKDIKNLYPLLKKLNNILISFSERYKNEKREKNLLDLYDLEYYCLNILLEKKDDNLIETKVAKELKNLYKTVMIDEYQDSNPIQELILSTVSGNENRFMVGDIKQSIYRFRNASPKMFLEKYNSYPTEGSGENLRIDLSKNFRSRDIILNTVNFLFSQIMTENTAEIDYTEKVALNLGAEFPEIEDVNYSKSTEIYIAVQKNNTKETSTTDIEDLQRSEMEAEITANRILELVDDEKGLKLWDKEKGIYRKAEYKDIAIIMRSVSKVGSIFSETLRKKGIPSFIKSKGNFFESIELKIIIALLNIIDNPRQDIHIITVLRSPIYFFTEDELMEIRDIKTYGDFYQCLIEYSNLEKEGIKVRLFLNDLSNWREHSSKTPISRFLSELYEETNLLNYVALMPSGELRKANLYALSEKAEIYENIGNKSLFRFIRYLQKIEKNSKEISGAMLNSEEENLVNIMTIHKSKGLEFPVVFVCGLATEFNKQDEQKNIVMHSELGIGPIYVDVKNRVKTKTLASEALAYKIRNENLSEEMRALYVALTRAEEKLILIGSVSELEAKKREWSRYIRRKSTKVSPSFMLKNKSYFDWICSAFSSHKNAKIIRTVEIEDFEINKNLFNYPIKLDINIITKEMLISADEDEEKNIFAKFKEMKKNIVFTDDILENKLNWKYPYAPDMKIPTTLSVSEIKRIWQEEDTNMYSENLSYKEPNFITEEKTFTNVEVGTIVHKFIEHLSFKYVDNIEEYIKDLLEDLVSKNIMKKEEAEVLSIKKMIEFLKSPLYRRIAASKSIKKEIPFVMEVLASEIYNDLTIIDSDLKIMVHGVIDCYFHEGEELVILDYKTDKTSNLEKIKNRYTLQLNIYKRAVEKSTGKKVKDCIIYLFDSNQELYM